MIRLSLLGLSLLIALSGTTSAQRITFRQDNTALPPFGGYVPGTGAVMTASPRAGVTFRQGSADAALPPFGGYVPGTGARIDFGNAARASAMRQQAAAMSNQVQRALPQQFRGNAQFNRPSAQATAAPARDGKDVARANRRARAATLMLKKGNQAVAKGNLKMARKYFLLGIKRDAPEVNETLRERLAEISGSATTAP